MAAEEQGENTWLRNTKALMLGQADEGPRGHFRCFSSATKFLTGEDVSSYSNGENKSLWSMKLVLDFISGFVRPSLKSSAPK